MCLILFKYQPDDHHKLVLVSNRDEFHQRESIPAAYWPHQPHIFGGIDNVAGGSWLSIDTSGRLAAVTNVRKPPYRDNTKLSRGHLVRDFLSQQRPATDFIKHLKERGADYGLFNLLLMDHTGLWYFSNTSYNRVKVPIGIHGLSNARLDTPWPKLSTALTTFRTSLTNNTIDHSQLLSMMQSQIKPKDDDLPNTGVGIEFERFLSPIFIKGEDYGTRSTTLLTVGESSIKFLELSYSPNGKINGEIKQKISIC